MDCVLDRQGSDHRQKLDRVGTVELKQQRVFKVKKLMEQESRKLTRADAKVNGNLIRMDLHRSDLMHDDYTLFCVVVVFERVWQPQSFAVEVWKTEAGVGIYVTSFVVEATKVLDSSPTQWKPYRHVGVLAEFDLNADYLADSRVRFEDGSYAFLGEWFDDVSGEKKKRQ